MPCSKSKQRQEWGLERETQVFPALSGSELLSHGICSTSHHSASQSSCSLPELLGSMKNTVSFLCSLKYTSFKAIRCDTFLPRFWGTLGNSDSIGRKLHQRKDNAQCSCLSRSLSNWKLWGLASQPGGSGPHPSRPFSIILPPPFPDFKFSFPGTSWPFQDSRYSSR